MKWKYLYQITAASRTPDYGGYRPQIPVLSVLCSQLNLLNPPPNKIPGYVTAKEHVDWTNAERNLVTFSDESKFNIHGCTNKYVTQNLLIHESLT